MNKTEEIIILHKFQILLAWIQKEKFFDGGSTSYDCTLYITSRISPYTRVYLQRSDHEHDILEGITYKNVFHRRFVHR